MTQSMQSPTSRYLTDGIECCSRKYGNDLFNKPASTLFYTPKIIHNLMQNWLSPVRDALGLGYVFDLLGKILKPVFGGEAKDRKWFTNYFQLGSIVNALQYLQPLPNFPLVGNKIWGSVAGGLLQGFDGCSWQVKISKYPVTAFVTGAINGLLCCAFQNFCSQHLFGRIFSENIAGCLSFATTWALSSKAMCKIEEEVFKAREKTQEAQGAIVATGSFFRNLVSNRAAPKPARCCER